MSREDCNGPCKVDEKSADPVSAQLWLHVRKALHKLIDSMKHIFQALEIDDNKKSPFCNKAHTLLGLMEQILTFCPKTFACNIIMDSAELPINVTLNADNVEVTHSEDVIA